MFESQNGDFDIQKSHLNNKGCLVVSSGLENAGVVGKTDIKAKIFSKHTITCDMFGNVFYRDFNYKMVTHARIFSLSFLNKNFNKKSALYIVSAMNYLKFKFSYSNMASFKKIENLTISLPAHSNGKIAFDFIETFIKAIEKESIKDVVLWSEKGLKTYKEVVNSV